MPTTDSRRGPGRPPRVDASAIEAAAIELFLEHGYAATTIPAIAAHCRVGRTTVFRYFPTKADLIWAGFDAHLAHLAAVLWAADDTAPVMGTVLDAAVEAFTYSCDSDGVWLKRYRVLRSASELREAESVRWAGWRTTIAAFVAARTDDEAEGVVPAAIAGAVLAAYLAVHQAWAVAERAPAAPGATLRHELEPVCAAVGTLLSR